MTTIYFANGTYFFNYLDEICPSTGQYIFAMMINGKYTWMDQKCSYGYVYINNHYRVVGTVDLKTLPRAEGHRVFNKKHNIIEGFFVNGILNGFVMNRNDDGTLETEGIYKDARIVGRQKHYSKEGNKYIEHSDVENIGEYRFTSNEGNDDVFILVNEKTGSCVGVEITTREYSEYVICCAVSLMRSDYCTYSYQFRTSHLGKYVRIIDYNGIITLMGENYSLDGTITYVI